MNLKDLLLDRSILSGLSDVRQSLGAPFISINIDDSHIKIHNDEFSVLSKSIEGSFKEILDKIDLKQEGFPLLDKNGQCRFLYIPDHTWIAYGKYKNREYNKVHITYCSKLQEMEHANRGDRYSFTTENSGEFEIQTSKKVKRKENLNVCKICLRVMSSRYEMINYGVFNRFDYKKFSIDFENNYPESFNKAREVLKDYDYPYDWNNISHNYRKSVNWKCEDCGKDCSLNHFLLDTHHINGIKSDCNYSNLKALCKHCHSKQPGHGHYRLP